MDGEVNGAQAQREERQGLQGEQAGGRQRPQAQEIGAGNVATGGDAAGAGSDGDDVGTDVVATTDGGGAADKEYQVALTDRDKKIAELEAQVAEAAKSAEAANALARQIEELKRASDDERVGYELKLAGCRSVRAGRVLLADHKGDMAALKKAEPWLFGETAGSGATGLEPAGASKGESDEMKRWRAIAGLE